MSMCVCVCVCVCVFGCVCFCFQRCEKQVQMILLNIYLNNFYLGLDFRVVCVCVCVCECLCVRFWVCVCVCVLANVCSPREKCQGPKKRGLSQFTVSQIYFCSSRRREGEINLQISAICPLRTHTHTHTHTHTQAHTDIYICYIHFYDTYVCRMNVHFGALSLRNIYPEMCF